MTQPPQSHTPAPQAGAQRTPGAAETAAADGKSGAEPRTGNSFLDHLVRSGVVPADVAAKVMARPQDAARDKRKLIEILVEEHGLPRAIVMREVAQFYSFRIIELSDRRARRLPPGRIMRMLSALPDHLADMAVRNRVLPYELADNPPDKLLVVTPMPAEREVHDVARAFGYKRFEICFMADDDWAELWRQVNLEKQMMAGEPGEISALDEPDDRELDTLLEREINRGQLAAMVENLLTDAVRLGASDIHVMPRGVRKTDIMFRLDGRLKLWYTVEDARAEAVIAVVKGRATNLDRFERLAAQDGAAQKIVDGQTIRFRVSIIPVVSRELTGKFESVVIRILRDADASVSLKTIGFDPYSLEVFQEAIRKPHGMVILTGPTGSGKSTTLVAALRSVMSPSLNTITVEDPVEYLLEGARQVKLSHKLDFDSAVRAILRHDPDIVMVGEMRDRITADVAIKLANTGHLTFSTLHTNDAPSAVSRLFKMGVEPFLIGQALNIVVAQRLVRRLCERCKAPAEGLQPHTLERAGFAPGEVKTVHPFRAVGCINCVDGYRGRTAVHESLYVTPEIRSLILESRDQVNVDALRAAAVRHGMRGLRRSGLDLVKRGVTTLDEVLGCTTAD